MNNLNTILNILSNLKSTKSNTQTASNSANLYPSSDYEFNKTINQHSNLNQEMLVKLLSGDKDNLAKMLLSSNPMLSAIMPLLQQKKTAKNTVKINRFSNNKSIDFSNLTKVNDYHLSTKE